MIRNSLLFAAAFFAIFTRVARKQLLLGRSSSRSTYQRITGCEVTTYAYQESPAFPKFINQVLDLVVNEVGINRVRLEIRSGR